MWGPFHHRSSVNINQENVWTNSYVTCTKSCKESKRNSIGKGTSEMFDCIFLAQFFFFGDNQNLRTIFQVGWKLLFFQNLIPTMKNRSSAQQKLVSFNYPYIVSVYMVGKAGFSLTHGSKRVLNRSLVLMIHIFEESENNIIKVKPNFLLSIEKEPLSFFSS